MYCMCRQNGGLGNAENVNVSSWGGSGSMERPAALVKTLFDGAVKQQKRAVACVPPMTWANTVIHWRLQSSLWPVLCCHPCDGSVWLVKEIMSRHWQKNFNYQLLAERMKISQSILCHTWGRYEVVFCRWVIIYWTLFTERTLSYWPPMELLMAYRAKFNSIFWLVVHKKLSVTKHLSLLGVLFSRCCKMKVTVYHNILMSSL